MFRTPVTELLGIATPIVAGTMMHLARAEFVAALCNAGALGVLASAIFREPEALRAEVRRLRDLTDRPFAVNINLFPALAPPDNRALVDALVEEGVRIVETSGTSAPVDLVPLFKEHGLVWIHKCVGVRYARKAAGLGADAVTVVGYENGGATGKLDVTTLVLVPRTVDAVGVPVIGGGGVADGRGLYAVLSLGAGAAIVGSRFLLAEECPVHPGLKRALADADEGDTAVILRSLFPHRVWLNAPARRAIEIEAAGGDLDDLLPYVSGEASKRLYATGDLAAGTVSCSQSIGLARAIMPARDIVAGMVAGAEAEHRRLSAMLA